MSIPVATRPLRPPGMYPVSYSAAEGCSISEASYSIMLRISFCLMSFCITHITHRALRDSGVSISTICIHETLGAPEI